MSMLSIFRPARFARLMLADAQNISRDPILIFTTMLSVVPAILLSLYRSELDAAGVSYFGISAINFYVHPPALIMPAFMIGWVAGFLMLEDRDDGPLLAMETTPPGKSGFLLYRTSVAAVLGFGVGLLGARLLYPDLPWPISIFLSAIVAADTVIVAFLLLALARNKVEGLALSKLLNIGAMMPLVAIFPSAFRFIGGIFPTFWVGEYFGMAGPQAISPAISATMLVLMHALWILIMLRVIQNRIG